MPVFISDDLGGSLPITLSPGDSPGSIDMEVLCYAIYFMPMLVSVVPCDILQAPSGFEELVQPFSRIGQERRRAMHCSFFMTFATVWNILQMLRIRCHLLALDFMASVSEQR